MKLDSKSLAKQFRVADGTLQNRNWKASSEVQLEADHRRRRMLEREVFNLKRSKRRKT